MLGNHKKLIWFAYALALAGAIFLSLKTVFALVAAGPDALLSLTLWQGVKSGGWEWLTHFIFTPDNWLLSIIPFNFLCFALLGAQPGLVIFSGWLVYALAALTCGALAQTLGARRAAILLPILLLCLGLFTQTHGFASYPTSHDVTNLYGLAALLCALRGLRHKNDAYAPLVLLLCLLGTLSDPWMIPAYDAPMALMGLALLWRFRRRVPAHRVRELLLGTALILLLLRTHLMALFGFLPAVSAKFASPALAAHNGAVLLRDLGGLFNLLPWEYSAPMLQGSLCLGVWAIAALTASLGARRAGLRQNRLLLVFILTGGLSMAASTTCVTLINVPMAGFSARFVLNVLYLFITLLAIMLDLGWQSFNNWTKTGFSAVMLLFFIAGLASTAPAWRKPGFAVQDRQVENRIEFLTKNHLDYGYGPYWGALANAVTALSHGKIILRPVMFNTRNGMMTAVVRAQSSLNWLTAQDIPRGQKNFFIWVADDGEECPNIRLCLAGITTQFGPPVRVLHDGAASILVWHHALLGYPYGSAGEYWGGDGWSWMGRSITLTSRQPMQVALRAVARNGPITRVTLTLNGARQWFALGAGQIKTVKIPAHSVARIAASPDFPGARIGREYRKFPLTLRIDLPQPAP